MATGQKLGSRAPKIRLIECLQQAGVPLRDLSPKQQSWTNESSGAGLIIVEHGLLEQFVLTATQKQVIALHYPGEPPALWMPDAHLRALTRSRARLVTSQVVAQLIEIEEALCGPLQRAAEWQVNVAMSWLANVARKEADARLAYFLCEHAYRSGGSGLDEPTVERLKQHDVANIVCVTPVQVNRSFAKFLKGGLIERRGATFTLKQIAELARLASFKAEVLAPID